MLKAGFIILTLALALLLFVLSAVIANRAFTEVQKQKKFKIKTALVLIIWITYISIVSLAGIFENASFPPRIPLLLVIPSFVMFIYFFTAGRFKTVIANTPASWPVYFQSFRIFVELLILAAALKGILPKAASFEGYNFDIVIGLTAPIVAVLLNNGKLKPALLLAWNFAGLATLSMVVFILISHAYFFKIWDQSESILNKGFGLFPFTFLAGFFMPLAVLMHIFSIIKTRQLK